MCTDASSKTQQLFTHASLMFGNECLKDKVKFEGTTAAIVMAGLVVSFFVDYGCHRLAKSLAGANRTAASAKLNDDLVNVLILEAGIIFHSICKLRYCCLWSGIPKRLRD